MTWKKKIHHQLEFSSQPRPYILWVSLNWSSAVGQIIQGSSDIVQVWSEAAARGGWVGY